MLKQTICLLLVLALFQTASAAHCTTSKVAVYKSYTTNFCYNKPRKCVNYRTYKVKQYKTSCKTVRKYCGQSCKWYRTHTTKCVKVKQPYFVYVNVKKTYKKRTCSTSVNKSFWNYKKCLTCKPTTYTKTIRTRKCKYRMANKCTKHCIRKKRCTRRYHNLKVCKQVFSHYRTYRKKYVTYTSVRFCKSVKRYRKTYKTIRKCKQCRGIPSFYDKVIYRSAKQFRRRAIERCCNKDLFTFYSCVFDRAHGEVNTRRESQRVRQILNTRGSHASCASTGDPHLKSFCGNRFNAYNAEHQLLYQAGGVRVSAQTKYSKWGKRSINNRVSVQFGSSYHLFTLPASGYYCGCKWSRTYRAQRGNNFRLTINQKNYRRYDGKFNGHYVTIFVHARGYIDVYVKAPKGYAANSKGLCSGCNVRGNFTMRHIYAIKFRSACERKRLRFLYCKRQCKTPSQLLKCMKDAA